MSWVQTVGRPKSRETTARRQAVDHIALVSTPCTHEHHARTFAPAAHEVVAPCHAGSRLFLPRTRAGARARREMHEQATCQRESVCRGTVEQREVRGKESIGAVANCCCVWAFCTRETRKGTDDHATRRTASRSLRDGAQWRGRAARPPKPAEADKPAVAELVVVEGAASPPHAPPAPLFTLPRAMRAARPALLSPPAASPAQAAATPRWS